MHKIFSTLFIFLLTATFCLAQQLTYDDIMRGFVTNIQGKARLEWFDSLYPYRNSLTNVALRSKVTIQMINIMQSKDSSNQDKCAAAHIIGLFSLDEGTHALIENISLWNQKTGPDSIRLREGEYPSLGALVKIGEPAIPEIMNFVGSTANSYQLQLAAKVILFIKGQKDGAEFLKQSMTDQTDSKKKENLKAALSSEYFTDPKYRLSGPGEKVKAMLAQESQNAEVTNKDMMVAPHQTTNGTNGIGSEKSAVTNK